MATLEEFIKTGQLGPIRLGVDPFTVYTAIGDPEFASKKNNPLEVKYGSLNLTFWKHDRSKPQLMDIELHWQPTYSGVPEAVRLIDIGPDEEISEVSFRAYLHEISYLPTHLSESATRRSLIMPSGVVANFANDKLVSLRLSQQERKEKTDSPLSDEREPAFFQINGMLEEAETALRNELIRPSVILAWAGLEAVLRRFALSEGMRGQIGVQPNILMRQAFSRGILSEADMRFLESMRQLRTAIVHGLAPVDFPDSHVWRIIQIARGLLDILRVRYPASN